MILVDTSVWVDYFRGTSTAETTKLDSLLGRQPLAIGDLILTEVLQGVTSDQDFRRTRKLLLSLEYVDLCGRDVALLAAEHYRDLRKRGVTVRKTVDAIIATWCIHSGYELLHNDRDFDGFAHHLGLRIVRCRN